MRFQMLCPVSVFLLAIGTGPAFAAPAPKGEIKADRSAAENIRKALESTGKFEFKDVNLTGVMNTIREQYKIDIVIDRFVIQQMGLDPDGMTVNLDMKEGKLRNALRGMVGQYNLTFAIVGESLVITTEEVAVYRQLKQRINVDFEAVPLSKAVKDLSSRYGVNVVVDPRTVKSKAADNPVTLQVDDVPFESAIRLLCEMADLKPARMGNVIFVTTEARADKLKDGDSLVPTPGLPTPGLPQVIPGLGAFGGGVLLPPVVATPPAVVKEDAPPPKEDDKKEEPKKP